MSQQDDELFLQEMQQMQGLNKLTGKKAKVKVQLDKRQNKDKQSLRTRQQAATEKVEQVEAMNPLSDYHVPQVHPGESLGYRRPGIQESVYRKLRLGRLEIDARLDLHGMTIEVARQKLLAFIAECIEHDIRTVLVMPGKGDRNVEAPAKLKSYFVHWLPQLDDVLAYHSAQPRDGGSGAFYLLLKKNRAKKSDDFSYFQ